MEICGILTPNQSDTEEGMALPSNHVLLHYYALNGNNIHLWCHDFKEIKINLCHESNRILTIS